jgi:hypothetical protein
MIRRRCGRQVGIRRRDGRFLGERTTKKKQIPHPLPRARDDNLKRIATNTNYARLNAATTDSNATATTVREDADARASWGAALRTGAAGSQDELRCSAIHKERPYRIVIQAWRLVMRFFSGGRRRRRCRVGLRGRWRGEDRQGWRRFFPG